MRIDTETAEGKAYSDFFADFERVALFALLKRAEQQDPSFIKTVTKLWYDRNMQSIKSEIDQMIEGGMSEQDCIEIRQSAQNVLNDCKNTIDQIASKL